jgi:hypothetical protein
MLAVMVKLSLVALGAAGVLLLVRHRGAATHPAPC